MCIIFIFYFQSNLGVLYMLKYECSTIRKSVKKKNDNIFFIPPISWTGFNLFLLNV